MRKFMTKEVTATTIKFGRIVVNEEGIPVVEQFEPHVVLGNIDKEKAQKLVNKETKSTEFNVFAVTTETTKYKMEVADFIKYATPVTDEDDLDAETEEEGEEGEENE